MPTAIEVININKTFGKHHVLHGVTLTVEEGTTRVILGGSGSGKTVIMKHMIGLLKPDSGEVRVFGQNIVPLKQDALVEMRKSFGMVFQQAALFDSMSVFDNVAFPLVEGAQKVSKEDIKRRVEEKLSILGLGQAMQKFPSELSGGMRKRVGLARALVTEPKIVLYDEPTTGLDPITTDNVDQMILEAKQKFGVTSVVISHDIASALRVADRVAFLHEGTIVEDTSPAELRKSQHPFVKKFLSTWFDK
ncbi:MAG: ABC transporter ATP-binding protein [Deltaproteobacteria bacterium]|nr:ABC transporter ATP-binding protein [Deltaproteobacteria bacterium]